MSDRNRHLSWLPEHAYGIRLGLEAETKARYVPIRRIWSSQLKGHRLTEDSHMESSRILIRTLNSVKSFPYAIRIVQCSTGYDENQVDCAVVMNRW